jgi:hypothetical protein
MLIMMPIARHLYYILEFVFYADIVILPISSAHVFVAVTAIREPIARCRPVVLPSYRVPRW